jgi:hypothetical protein
MKHNSTVPKTYKYSKCMGERYNFPSFFLLVLVYCVPLVEKEILVIFGPVTTSTNIFLTEVTFLKLAFFYNE